jgi:signal transduction histidine kinase
VATFIDELVGRGEGRRAAADAERRRLASDLHAEAMPALRRALRDVEAGRPADEVAAELRALAGELEGVMTERRDPVLESLGLVRALEALAERTEDRGGPRVELIVSDDPGVPSGARPVRAPLAVESVALRIAGLALDNATRHGRAQVVEILVAVGPSAVTLRIADDGSGIGAEDESRAFAEGRHGIADMHRLAAEQGARVLVGRGSVIQPAGEEAGPGSDSGTVVRFDWPAGKPPTRHSAP